MMNFIKEKNSKLIKIFNYLLILYTAIIVVSSVFISLITQSSNSLTCREVQNYFKNPCYSVSNYELEDKIGYSIDTYQPKYSTGQRKIGDTEYYYRCIMEVSGKYNYKDHHRLVPDSSINIEFRFYKGRGTGYSSQSIGEYRYSYWDDLSECTGTWNVNDKEIVNAQTVINNISYYVSEENSASFKLLTRKNVNSTFLEFSKTYVKDAKKIHSFLPLPIYELCLAAILFIGTIVIDIYRSFKIGDGRLAKFILIPLVSLLVFGGIGAFFFWVTQKSIILALLIGVGIFVAVCSFVRSRS